EVWQRDEHPKVARIGAWRMRPRGGPCPPAVPDLQRMKRLRAGMPPARGSSISNRIQLWLRCPLVSSAWRGSRRTTPRVEQLHLQAMIHLGSGAHAPALVAELMRVPHFGDALTRPRWGCRSEEHTS